MVNAVREVLGPGLEAGHFTERSVKWKKIWKARRLILRELAKYLTDRDNEKGNLAGLEGLDRKWV